MNKAIAIRLSPKTRKSIAVAYFLFTTIVLLWPGNALPKTKLITIPFFDKIVHIVLFAILSWLALNAFGSSRKLWNTKIVGAICLYGILIEFVQLYFIPFRSFEIVDIVADTIGALLGLLILRRFKKEKRLP
jgi:VanZ family protein